MLIIIINPKLLILCMRFIPQKDNLLPWALCSRISEKKKAPIYCAVYIINAKYTMIYRNSDYKLAIRGERNRPHVHRPLTIWQWPVAFVWCMPLHTRFTMLRSKYLLHDQRNMNHCRICKLSFRLYNVTSCAINVWFHFSVTLSFDHYKMLINANYFLTLWVSCDVTLYLILLLCAALLITDLNIG